MGKEFIKANITSPNEVVEFIFFLIKHIVFCSKYALKP